MTIGVYTITNKINGKIYIGSSKNIEERFQKHKSNLKYNRHDNEHLQRSYNKHGLSNFRFDILTICDLEMQYVVEQHYIYEMKPEYNMYYVVIGDDEIYHWSVSNETKEKIRQTMLGVETCWSKYIKI